MKKISILLTIVLLGAVVCNGLPEKNETHLPAQCPPGSYDASEQGDQPYCLPCPQGFYNDKHNNFRSCKRHRKCKSSEVQISGTTKSNVVCKCKNGGRVYYNVDEEYGYNCRECENGNVSQAVAKNAFDDGDMACCPNDTIAIRNQSGVLQCLVIKRQQDCTAPPTRNLPIPKDDLTQSSDRRWLISGFVGLFTGLVLGFALTKLVSYCLKKRRQRSMRFSKASPPIYRYSLASKNMPPAS